MTDYSHLPKRTRKTNTGCLVIGQDHAQKTKDLIDAQAAFKELEAEFKVKVQNYKDWLESQGATYVVLDGKKVISTSTRDAFDIPDHLKPKADDLRAKLKALQQKVGSSISILFPKPKDLTQKEIYG